MRQRHDRDAKNSGWAPTDLRSERLEYLRRSGQEIVRPEILGLPSAAGRSERDLTTARTLVLGALRKGDGEQLRRISFNLFLAGQSCCDICDQCLATSFRSLGDLWEGGELEIYRERRSCEITMRLLYELRASLPSPGPRAPLAVGGTLGADPYTLPTTMVELILAERGWRSESLGVGLPAETLSRAIENDKPRLFWLSVSAVESANEFLAEYEKIYDVASSHGVAVVVGGRALTEKLRTKMRYSTYCDNLAHLTSFAAALGNR